MTTTPPWPRWPSEQVRDASRVVEVLEMRARTQPDRVVHSYLGEDGEVTRTSTFGQLFADASRAATRVLEHVAPGDRVVLLFASDLDFVTAFLGCHIAGVVPVPVMPPRQPTPAEAGRVSGIIEDAQARLVITSDELVAMARAFLGADPRFSALTWASVADLDGLAPTPVCPAEQAPELALLQYTSGSTSRPRGVMVGHDNLMWNLGDIYWAERNHADTVSVSWLPMSHDMGLIEGVLQPIYSGHHAYLMSPVTFLKHPLVWLDAVSTYGATVSGGPNFAYELAMRRLGDGPLPPYDFSKWAFAYNASEPVSAATMERFAERMAPVGFRREAIHPLFGLAEATLGVTEGRRGMPPRYQTRVGPGGDRTVVSCGWTAEHMEVAIVDPTTHARLPAGEEGEVWLAGPCITRGYWGRPEQTRAVFGATVEGEGDAAWMRTGDLGFQLDGELFVSGRLKEVIVCQGRNVYPQDLEVTAEGAHPLLRPGGVVAFRVSGGAGEAAAIVAEVDREALRQGVDPARLEDAARAVRATLARTHAIPVEAVVLVKPGTVPRTTSGKRQRLRVAKSYHAGRLEPLAQARRAAPDARAPGAAWLRSMLAEQLGVAPDALDPDLTLSELGVDSLGAVELLIHLDHDPTLAHVGLTQLLTRTLGDLERALREPAKAAAPTSWRDDAVLAADVQPRAGAPSGAAVLLTGATGFLGSHVAIELLGRTDHTVRCLVRGEGARARLLDGLADHPDWQDAWRARVDVLAADLGAPDLGLTAEEVAQVAADTRAVYHCAAMVNWVYPYAALRQVNVEGTRALLALACQAGAPFTYVSTLAVCWSLGHTEPVDEATTPTDHMDGVHLDYVRSKAVGEALVRQAAARGLPVSIIRPGLVFSHSETGAHRPGDFLSALCKGCIEMGAAPDLDWPLEVCAVDEVARWTVDLPPSTGDAVASLHLGAHQERLWRGLVLWMNLRGHPVSLTPYDAWCARLEEHNARPDAALRPLTRFFTRPVPGLGGLRMPQLYESPRRNPIDHAWSRERMAGAPRPTFDAAHLQETFDHLTRMGYLPAPTRRAAAPPDEGAARDALGALALEALEARHPGEPIRDLEVAREDARARHGIVSELASWRFGLAAGLHRLSISYTCGGRARALDAVLKAQVEDLHAIEVAQEVASLCGDALGDAWREHRSHHEMWRSHVREQALYRLDSPALRAHSPALYAARPDLLLLEDLTGAPMLDSLDGDRPWQPSHLEAAIGGIAHVHATSYGDADPPGPPGWWAPRRTGDALVAQRPLLEALLDFALTRPFAGWLGDAGRARVRGLLDDLPTWARAIDAHPHTLIHNDFNPRNLAFRPDGTLCAFDWELARHGLPQRDLAELLCFTLGADTSARALDGWLELHRAQLAARAGASIDAGAWREGFRLAMADLMITRLPLYVMLDHVHPQPFIERVTRTWARLDSLLEAA
jgi:thioester reductase-like protein